MKFFYREFNALLVECASLLVLSDKNNFHKSIDQALGKIGFFPKVDRAYYAILDQENITSSTINV
jgi:hypothetical protein